MPTVVAIRTNPPGAASPASDGLNQLVDVVVVAHDAAPTSEAFHIQPPCVAQNFSLGCKLVRVPFGCDVVGVRTKADCRTSIEAPKVTKRCAVRCGRDIKANPLEVVKRSATKHGRNVKTTPPEKTRMKCMKDYLGIRRSARLAVKRYGGATNADKNKVLVLEPILEIKHTEILGRLVMWC